MNNSSRMGKIAEDSSFSHTCGVGDAVLVSPFTQEFWFQLDEDQTFRESRLGKDEAASLPPPILVRFKMKL